MTGRSGWYVAAEWRGRRFRWTAPIAVWEVTLPAGSLEARLVVLPIRRSSPRPPP